MGGVDQNKELIDLLECPICTEFMYPPIFQCPNGHSVCSTCKPQLQNRCPQCQREIGDIRALTLEKMASILDFPCIYSPGGCSRCLKYDMKEAHEKECRFRPFSCPFASTTTSGSTPCGVTADHVEMLLTHLQIDHSVEVSENFQIDSVLLHQNHDANSKVEVYSCLSEYFCLHFEILSSPTDWMYMAYVTLMGNEIDAPRFRYNLEVGDDDGKLTWQGRVRSIRDAGKKIRDSCHGLVLPHCVARNLAEHYQEGEIMILRVKGFVWAIDEL